MKSASKQTEFEPKATFATLKWEDFNEVILSDDDEWMEDDTNQDDWNVDDDPLSWGEDEEDDQLDWDQVDDLELEEEFDLYSDDFILEEE